MLLALLALVPLGMPVAGRPVALYHVLAVPLALGATSRLHRVNRRILSFCAVAIGIALLGALLTADGSIAPLLSAYHFVAPYLVLVAFLSVSDIRRFLLYASSIGAVVSAATFLGFVLSGRMVLSVDGSVRYSIAEYFPFLAGNAQVNSWSAMLVASSLVSALALEYRRCTGRYRWFALAGLILPFLVISLSGSRANMFALAIVGVSIFARVISGGFIKFRRNRLRSQLIAIGLSFLVALSFSNGVQEDPRVRLTIESAGTGDFSSQFAGRDTRLAAMAEDLAMSPVIGTAFRDFSSRPALEGSSPHNQWVGSMHKVGIPLGILYSLGIVVLHRRARPYPALLSLLTVGILGSFYDVLTAPPGGLWFLALISLVWFGFPQTVAGDCLSSKQSGASIDQPR